MFSQTTEYALRIAVFLGSVGDEPATIRQIAKATQVPEGYLAKVLKSMSRAGIVHSQRGPTGGSVLARPADRITVHDVVQAVDPIRRITTCPLGIKSHGVNLCPLHRRLDHAIALVEKAFQESTIADLLIEPTFSPPMREALALPPPTRKRK